MSNNIPTFAAYMAGGTITKPQEALILAASSEDRSESIKKLTELKTSMELLIQRLKDDCKVLDKTINAGNKEACRLEKEKHETNHTQFQSILMKLIKTPKGGRRQTRRYSKHNKNRKQNLRSRRRRNKQA